MAYTTIDNPELYFQCKIYGFTTGAQSITFDNTDTSMQPDMVWIKSRSNAGYNHVIHDSVRGVTKVIRPNLNNDEDTYSDSLTSFDSNGFGLGGDGTNGEVNDHNQSQNYIAWCWKEASEIFDIVSYTGNGSNRTISHSLSAKPAMIFVKQRSADRDWWVYNKNLHGTDGATGVLYLSDNLAAGTSATTSWNSTAPTTSVFSLGTTVGVNADSGTYIAYLFAEKQGFSKFGTYEGNNTADGPFIYTGFRPAYIMMKSTSTGGSATYSWSIFDNKRSSYNIQRSQLEANTGDAEDTGDTADIDILSNGFKPRYSPNDTNGNNTYIYMAFAEQPFVNSKGVPANAR